MNPFESENFHLNPIIEDDAELIPLLSSEDEEQMNAEKFPDELNKKYKGKMALELLNNAQLTCCSLFILLQLFSSALYFCFSV